MPLGVLFNEPPHRSAVAVIHADATDEFHAAPMGQVRHQLPEIDACLPQRPITVSLVGLPPMFLQYLGGTVKRMKAVADHHRQRVHSRPGQFVDAAGHHFPDGFRVHLAQRSARAPEFGEGVAGIAVV